jgi:hypothetical protein
MSVFVVGVGRRLSGGRSIGRYALFVVVLFVFLVTDVFLVVDVCMLLKCTDVRVYM